MKKTIIDIKYIAKLSKLTLSEKEENKFSRQLEEVLGYFDELKKVDTSGVKPTSQTTGLTNIRRNDVVKSSLTQEEALSQTSNTFNGYFVVDMILENKEL